MGLKGEFWRVGYSSSFIIGTFSIVVGEWASGVNEELSLLSLMTLSLGGFQGNNWGPFLKRW